MKFIDTYDEILSNFESNEFNIELWRDYAKCILNELPSILHFTL